MVVSLRASKNLNALNHLLSQVYAVIDEKISCKIKGCAFWENLQESNGHNLNEKITILKG